MDLNSEKSKCCATCLLVGSFLGVAFMVFIDEAKASERDDMVTRTEALADQLVQPTTRELTAQIVQHTRLADDDMYQTGSWAGIQISYGMTLSYTF